VILRLHDRGNIAKLCCLQDKEVLEFDGVLRVGVVEGEEVVGGGGEVVERRAADRLRGGRVEGVVGGLHLREGGLQGRVEEGGGGELRSSGAGDCY
jgi:hypothetical protein